MMQCVCTKSLQMSNIWRCVHVTTNALLTRIHSGRMRTARFGQQWPLCAGGRYSPGGMVLGRGMVPVGVQFHGVQWEGITSPRPILWMDKHV